MRRAGWGTSVRAATMLWVTAGVLGAWLDPTAAQLFGPPKATLWDRWVQHRATDARRIDHHAWERFLNTYLDARHPSGIHRLDYEAVTPEDRQQLENYLRRLQATPISTYNRREQKAFWINLYNALTVKVVLDHYPVRSIRQIKIPPGLFTFGPWDGTLASVEEEPLSLNDIEHRILRPIWRDPGVHYGVNCASLGCPNLVGTAYTGENVDRLLARGGADYVNHPRGARFRSGRLRVSSIYSWFREDFGGTEAGVLEHLRRYASGELAERLQGYKGPIDDAYDWALNEP